MLMNVTERMVNPTHRYVATAVCPLGGNAAECAALEERIFDYEAAAAAALIEHLATAACHTQAQLARVVGAVPTHVKSFRLVHEDRGASASRRVVISDGAADYAAATLNAPQVLRLAPKGQAA
jgi:hypothetical protein